MPHGSRRLAASAQRRQEAIKDERSLIGCMLLSRDAIQAAVEMQLQPSDFLEPLHAALYELAVELSDNGEPVDPITVAELFKRKASAIQRATPGSLDFRTYARRVEDASLLRKLSSVLSVIGEPGGKAGA